MRFCYNCGKQVEDNILICPDCGALVKRYTDDMKPEDLPPTPEERTADTEGKRVYVDENGKTRFRGSLKFWFIITAIFCGYFALSFLCLIVVYHNQAYYEAFFPYFSAQELALFGGLDALKEMWTELMAFISQVYGFLIALCVLCIIKTASDVFLLISKKKLAFLIRQASVLTLCAACLVLIQNPVLAIAFAADGFITSLLIRQDRFLLL